MTPRMNEQTHRLTDLPGERNPFVCQQCGGSNLANHGNGIMRLSLDRWQECDHNDKPEAKILVLCNVCSKRMIQPHPRLYHKLDTNAPWPGCMALCVDCTHRDGIRCAHPQAKANGGKGVMLQLSKPVRGFIDGPAYRGRFEQYPKPPLGCRQKETSK